MLPRRTLTKKQKKKIKRKKSGVILIFTGLLIICASLFFGVFFDKEPIYVSPLSKNQITSTSRMEKLLKEKKIEYESLETTRDLYYIIKLDKNREVIIDPQKNITEQISSLQLILRQLKIDGKAFKRLDFRYQKPIISF
jgi:hypothetical protein